MIDKDNSGQITRTEFAKWMRDLGIKVSMGDIRKFVERYDQSSDSLINYEEFLSIVAPNQYRESLAETNVEEQGPPDAKKERRERSKEHAASKVKSKSKMAPKRKAKTAQTLSGDANELAAGLVMQRLKIRTGQIR